MLHRGFRLFDSHADNGGGGTMFQTNEVIEREREAIGRRFIRRAQNIVNFRRAHAVVNH